MSSLGPGCPARRFQISFGAEIFELGRKWMISEAKFSGFRGWKVGKLGGKIDLLKPQRIPGSKSTKHHQDQQITEKIGGYIWWGFLNLGRNQQN